MKITRIEHAAPRGPRAPALSQREKAIEAAIERSISPYVALKCGHLTTWESIMLYARWAPAANKRFCEICSKWVLPKPKPKPAPMPEEPLF